jgi:peptidoglycan/LPS O-acetylase OafA/YrhL
VTLDLPVPSRRSGGSLSVGYDTGPVPARHAVLTSTTLESEFDPRHNALNVMRLLLAALVVVVHASELGFGGQPHVGSTDLGALAVDAFFVLSGFLVVRSYLRLNSFRRYVWHRALRIMPGFWVCMLVTSLAFAPLLAVIMERPATSVFSGEDSAISYLTANAALLMRQFGIAGLPGLGGNPEVINGSLWTLFYEATCYGLAAGLGVFGILRHWPWLVLVAIAGLWLCTVSAAAGFNPLGSTYLLRFGLVFLLGTAGLLFADRIPINAGLALGSFALLVAAMLLFHEYRVVGAPAFAYLCLYSMVRLPLVWEPRWDLSYGLYVWHWPIAQTLVALEIPEYTHLPFILLTLVLTAGVSVLSWNFVEKPAMGFKHAAWVTGGRRRRRRAPAHRW